MICSSSLIYEDHSNISDWVPAALDEALQILDDRLQKPSIAVIIIVVLVLLALAFLPSLLSGFGGRRVVLVSLGGMEERGVGIEGRAGVVLRE